ncbi:MFS transporter [Liquorilactobacillus hordei]|uniref:MFS transporter n=1 Tax=Liquorilactobacillus hordei TaxID=468911 RepID=UPI0039EBD170
MSSCFPISIFSFTTFSITNARLLSSSVFCFASAMIFLLPPFIFEELMGLNVGITGLLVLGAPVGLVIFSRISGKLNDGHKNSMFSLLGLGIIAISLLGLAFSSQQAPAILITFFLFIYGIGGGFFQPASIAAIMQIGNNKNQSSLGALQRMVRNIAIASGTAIGSTIINLLSQKMVIGIRISWIITLFFVLIIICLSRIFNRKEQII